MLAMQELKHPPRILITRLSAIGDCIHTVPVVAALRRAFPNAFIAWATQSGPASLLEGLEGLDELIVLPKGWLKRWSSIRQVRAELQSHRFDIAIDPQSLTKSSLLGWLSGAKQRIGFAKGQGRELSPFLSTHRVSPQTTHVVERYLELLEPLGVEQPAVEFRLPNYSVAATSMQDFLKDHRLSEFALLNPGAGWNSKVWPHSRYGEVARSLYQRHGLRSVVLWAGERERVWAEAIVKDASAATVLAPDTSLPELAELCRSAKLFVGSDTGPMHLAAAVGTPCVAMYGPTKIEVCGPYGKNHVALQAWHQDGSSAQRRGDDNSAMRAITVEMVYGACDQLLADQRPSRLAS